MSERGREPLLIEIGCEEIPARMIPRAAEDLGKLLVGILDQAGLEHGDVRSRGGSRRLAARVESVQARQADRTEQMLGPPAKVAFSEDGSLTGAAIGFAKKQGIEPGQLAEVETDKGLYVGFTREVTGASVGQVLAGALPDAVADMRFPKTMRWAEGRRRWVRPVHWVVALHGEQVLSLELFGVAAGNRSEGHRFLPGGPVELSHPDRYDDALEAVHVVVDPGRRRNELRQGLHAAAEQAGGRLAEDPGLLEEVADLVEWPGLVQGTFDESFLELPRELLVTTLRHHQKCFSVEGPEGRLVPAFLAVANTDRDAAGHIRRGNEWVIGGRLADARFFWGEDRKLTLAERTPKLSGVVFHGKAGSFADKAERMGRLAARIAERVGLEGSAPAHAATAAGLAKNDLVTGTVGEFPELQGIVGGLLLRAENEPREVADAVYEHYRPAGPEDPIPDGDVGCVVSIADKLDSLVELTAAGVKATASKDPFSLRRAATGIFRIVIERQWPLSLNELLELTGRGSGSSGLLLKWLQNHLKDRGFTAGEIRAVLRPDVSPDEALGLPLPDIERRLEAIRTVRDREDFAHLVDLTKRIHNIIPKAGDLVAGMQHPPAAAEFTDPDPAGRRLKTLASDLGSRIDETASRRNYDQVVNLLAEFVEPTARFFEGILVIDPEHMDETYHRYQLLVELCGILTRYFDIRELAGQADRRA